MKSTKIIMYLILTILLTTTSYAEKYFVIDVNYILGSLTYNSHNVREIDRTIKYNDKSGFLVKTVSFGNADLGRIYYNMSENRNYLIYVPYDKNAVKILFYNQNNAQVMDIDVSSFADTCGNGVCEPYESYESCAKDCKSGIKNEVNKNISSSSSNEKKQNEKIPEVNAVEENANKQKTNYILWILTAIGFIAAVSAVFLIKKLRENQIVNSLRQYISENIRKGFTLQQIRDALYREGYKEKEVDKAIKTI